LSTQEELLAVLPCPGGERGASHTQKDIHAREEKALSFFLEGEQYLCRLGSKVIEKKGEGGKRPISIGAFLPRRGILIPGGGLNGKGGP